MCQLWSGWRRSLVHSPCLHLGGLAGWLAKPMRDSCLTHAQVDEVVDSIVVSLSKFATVLHPGAPKSVVAFGESEKARLAVETMFTIANR